MPYEGYESEGRDWDGCIYFAVRILTPIIFIGVLALIFGVKKDSSDGSPPKPLPKASAPPVGAIPENGYGVYEFGNAAADGFLAIQSGNRYQGHVVVKLEKDDKFVCWFFVRKEGMHIAFLPSGVYRMKLACGAKWIDETQVFGPKTVCVEIMTPITVPLGGRLTVDLRGSITGTMKDKRINGSGF